LLLASGYGSRHRPPMQALTFVISRIGVTTTVIGDARGLFAPDVRQKDRRAASGPVAANDRSTVMENVKIVAPKLA
jgi:hypothetical protein